MHTAAVWLATTPPRGAHAEGGLWETILRESATKWLRADLNTVSRRLSSRLWRVPVDARRSA